MKNKLLLFLVPGMIGYAQGQKSTSNKPAHISISMRDQLKLKMKQLNDANHASNISHSSDKRAIHRTQNLSLPILGSSANPNSVRDASTTATTANKACNLIVMTHRGDSSKINACGSGVYEPAFSTDGGNTWDTNVYISCNIPTRYPNGAIFNPAGNTSPTSCYVAMAGPYTNSSTAAVSWVETAYGSITIGNTNAHEMLWTNGSPGLTQDNGDLSYMSSSDDSTVHVIGEGWSYTGNTFQTWQGAVLTTGKFNAAADSFTWTQTLFRPHLVPPVLGFATMTTWPFDSLAGPLGTPGTAWSQDGKTGYVVIFGNLDSAGYNYVSNQPIVYKTTDAGTTWAMMPPFNFRNIPALSTYLIPSSDSGVVEPLWFLYYSVQGGQDDYDLTVDVNGNLHIFGAITSGYYSNPDSAYEIELFNSAVYDQKGFIYDVYTTTSSGGWQARFIDSMRTYPTDVVEYNNDWGVDANGSIAYGARIQASRTTDGKKVFCTWEDDFSMAEPDSLVNPDVFGQGFDVTNNNYTSVYQFTSTSNNYLLCVSDIAIDSGSSPVKYTVPCTFAYPQSVPCYPADPVAPINYYYLGNVHYTDNSFVGIPSISNTGFSITPNYPNPFNNITRFDVNMTNEGQVGVVVYNLVGEKIMTIPTQKMSNGKHTMTINGAGLSSGVYFYTVTVNNQSLTQKMIVQ